MRLSFLDLLRCPQCGGTLQCEAGERDGDHVMSGSLRCGCGATYAIQGGVPRMVGTTSERVERTAEAFAYDWKAFPRIDEHHRQQFLDWIKPVRESDFQGQVVLDGGCGKGRHMAMALRFGAQAVVGIDLSEAVDVAFAQTREQPAAHVVQGNLLNPPLARDAFDYVWSIGVLHHLEDPGAGFASLVRHVKPGGRISVWVYGHEGNSWIRNAVDPMRRTLGRGLPRPALNAAAGAMTVPLFALLKLLYRPMNSALPRTSRRLLFYNDYMNYISGFPFYEVHHIVFDQLVAPTTHYITQEVIGGWFHRPDLTDVRIEWHNRNSWRGLATRC